MDYEAIKGNRMRTRSFRDENYNRRVFLRSYPLHWGEDEYSKEDTARVADNSNQKKDEYNKEETIAVTVKDQSDQKKPKKKIFLCVFYWGVKKISFLRRLKHQLEIYFIAFIPNGFKKPTALIQLVHLLPHLLPNFIICIKYRPMPLTYWYYNNVTSLVHKRTFIHATHSMLQSRILYFGS
ncbi:hypothetical protein ACB098_03G122700 [Castanea mollissima]